MSDATWQVACERNVHHCNPAGIQVCNMRQVLRWRQVHCFTMMLRQVWRITMTGAAVYADFATGAAFYDDRCSCLRRSCVYFLEFHLILS